MADEMRHDVADVLLEEAVCSEHLSPHDADAKASHEDDHQHCASLFVAFAPVAPGLAQLWLSSKK